MSYFIDLHIHSRYSSDGEFEPAELVRLCSETGVRCMAIADHNNVKAVEEAQAAAAQAGIRCIPAIEIDCHWREINFHLLGYGIDYCNPAFNKLGEDFLRQDLEQNEKKLRLVNELGFALRREQLEAISATGAFTGEEFAEVLFSDQRYSGHALLAPYRKGGHRSDNPYVNFYWDYFAQGCPCYTHVTLPSLRDTVNLVHGNGGITVLAHPGNNLKGRYELFKEMLREGIDGVEAFSSYHDTAATAYFSGQGEAHGLLLTCGSDYHGKIKPMIHLGETNCTIDEHEIEAQLRVAGLIL